MTFSGRPLVLPASVALAGLLGMMLWPELRATEPETAGLDAVAVKLLGAVGWLGMAWLGSRALAVLMLRAGRSGRPVPSIIHEVGRFILFGMAAIAIFGLAFEQPVTGIFAASGILIAILGFALRGTLADIFSGIALNVEHPFRIGDWIRLDPRTTGRVVEINWRATRLVTLEEVELIVPNSMLAMTTVQNMSAPAQRYRASVRMVLPHGLSVDRARRLLLSGLHGAHGILADPVPDVVIDGVEADGIAYQARYWVPGFSADAACRDAVFDSLVRTLQRANVVRAAPRLQLSRTADAGMPADHRMLLRSVYLFEPFTEEELDRLRARMRPHCLRPGQSLIRQGEVGGSLFIICEGVLEVHHRLESGQTVILEKMHPGDVVGEMSLLTGERRSATVTAITGVEALELTEHEIRPFLKSRPAIAEGLAALMAERAERNAALATRLPEMRPAAAAPKPDVILGKLRAFLGLG